ncbi:MAG TPA: SRPBCC family protein [Ktedonobacterales bacterium]|nr:SRPBCC family protein [Ktedonobacterales bacterium]
MTVSVCPIATVSAPLASVWAVLTEPASYSAWWDARTKRIEPAGPAAAGQVVHASSRALGRSWPVTTRVLAVDAGRHALDMETALPLGITVRNHILCDPLDATATRVTFG